MKNILELSKKEIIKLAKLSSWIHESNRYCANYQYEGRLYEYFDYKIHQDIRKDEYNIKFHVVLLKADAKEKEKYGQLNRVFIVDYLERNNFKLFNINEKNELVLVKIFQDDLFRMHKFLIDNNYEIITPKISK